MADDPKITRSAWKERAIAAKAQLAERDAAIAAAYEAAAREIDCQGCRGSCGDPANCHAEYAKDIRALTPSDALSALERVRAEARSDVAGLVEALRRISVTQSYRLPSPQDIARAALAAWEGRK
jgi:hypothetical protein